jgi:hypothetical protein
MLVGSAVMDAVLTNGLGASVMDTITAASRQQRLREKVASQQEAPSLVAPVVQQESHRKTASKQLESSSQDNGGGVGAGDGTLVE